MGTGRSNAMYFTPASQHGFEHARSPRGQKYPQDLAQMLVSNLFGKGWLHIRTSDAAECCKAAPRSSDGGAQRQPIDVDGEKLGNDAVCTRERTRIVCANSGIPLEDVLWIAGQLPIPCTVIAIIMSSESAPAPRHAGRRCLTASRIACSFQFEFSTSSSESVSEQPAKSRTLESGL